MPGKGFSIIEFIVASVLTLGILTASGTALSSAERSMANSRSVDVSAAIGISVLEQTALFNCQRTVDLSATTLGFLENVCAGVYEPGNVSAASFAGDYIYEKTLNGGDYIVEVSSAWIYSKTSQTRDNLTASDMGSSPTTCPSVHQVSTFRQPSLLSREVTVSWSTARNGFVSRKYLSSEYYYRENTVDVKGSMIIQVPQGAYAVIRSKTDLASKPVARKSVCTNASGNAEILFPYLTPGEYLYSVYTLTPLQDSLSAKARLDVFRSASLPDLPVTLAPNTNKICSTAGVCV